MHVLECNHHQQSYLPTDNFVESQTFSRCFCCSYNCSSCSCCSSSLFSPSSSSDCCSIMYVITAITMITTMLCEAGEARGGVAELGRRSLPPCWAPLPASGRFRNQGRVAFPGQLTCWGVGWGGWMWGCNVFCKVGPLVFEPAALLPFTLGTSRAPHKMSASFGHHQVPSAAWRHVQMAYPHPVQTLAL